MLSSFTAFKVKVLFIHLKESVLVICLLLSLGYIGL
jgi:hypothetical protein